MATSPETKAAGPDPRVPPLKLTRTFPVLRETVFKAWTTAEHVKRWYSPEGSTIPEAEVDARAGGVFAYRMLFHDGSEHWTRGRFVELTPVSRLVLDLEAFGANGKSMFRCRIEVGLSEALGGTRVDILQSFRDVDPALAEAIAAYGPGGWGSTFNRLDTELLRMAELSGTVQRSAAHATFHLTRTYAAPVERVWKALTVPEAKLKWFGSPGEVELLERKMDIRVGGTERLKGRWKSGMVSDFQAIYHDLIPSQRLVYSYVMHIDGKMISVSLATLELRAEGAKTTLAVTEQGAFLDGYDDAGAREHGTGLLLDALGASLAE